MTRPLRIEYPGAIYHITSRGDRQENIYQDDHDRELFLDILSWVIQRTHWLCHAYCLMDNHYHILIETQEANLSYGMRQLNGVYTQKYNKIHNVTGHLFQGRYKSIIVEKQSYLLELCRYIVLNPVRANMVKYPWQWAWSSYRATAGKTAKLDFLTSDWILLQFGNNRESAQKDYVSFILDGIGNDSLWEDLRGGIILGKDSFLVKIQGYIDEKEKIGEIPRIERYASRPSLSKIFNPAKNKITRNNKIYESCYHYGYTLTEIGNHLNLHYATVSKILKNRENR